jgi:uncharacterized protein YjiS (DUF1127 family)
MAFLRRWLMRMAGRPGRGAGMGGLLSLDDRLLADIGLRRAELAAVASGLLPLDQLALQGPLDPGDGRSPRAPAALAPSPAPERWDAAA